MRGQRAGTIAALIGIACAGLGNNFKEPNVQLDHAVVRGVGLGGAHTVVFIHPRGPRPADPSQ